MDYSVNTNHRKKWMPWLIAFAAAAIIAAMFFILDGPAWISRQTQSGVTLLTLYKDGVLLQTDGYTVTGDLSPHDGGNGYCFETGYGEVRGTVHLGDLEIECGFHNTNNWHHIHIRLDVSHQDGSVTVTQTVTYQTDNGRVEVLVTENTAQTGTGVSVFKDGI